MPKRRTIPWILTVLFLGLLLANFFLETGRLTVSRTSDYSGFKAQLQKTLPVLMKKYRIPGAAVALIRKGKIDFVEGFGWADQKAGIKVGPDTVFQVASNSKTVAAWGLMKLVEGGKLALDTPVNQYLTRWKLPRTKYDNNGVTLRRLLSHTAGMSQGSYTGYAPGEKLPTLEQSLSGQAPGTKELHLIAKPGAKYKYSGGGYTLIQLITEEVTGEPFAQYMEEEVLKPLGMENSSYQWKPELRTKTAVPYGVLGKPIPNYLFTEVAAAGLYTTATDFARFVAANLNIAAFFEDAPFAGEGTTFDGEGTIRKQSLARMYTPGKKNYGLGYIIKKLPDHTRLIYHGGTNRGWRSQFALLPERGDGLVILTNSDYGANLHIDLVSIWTQWETGYRPDFYLKNIGLRVLVETAAMFLGLLFILFIWKSTRDICRKKRESLITAKLRAGLKVRKLLLNTLLPILFVILWLTVFYTGLVYNGWTLAAFAPWGFNLVTYVVIFGAVFWLLGGLWMKAGTTGPDCQRADKSDKISKEV